MHRELPIVMDIVMDIVIDVYRELCTLNAAKKDCSEEHPFKIADEVVLHAFDSCSGKGKDKAVSDSVFLSCHFHKRGIKPARLPGEAGGKFAEEESVERTVERSSVRPIRLQCGADAFNFRILQAADAFEIDVRSIEDAGIPVHAEGVV